MVSSSRSHNQGSPVIHGQIKEKATTRTVPIHDHLFWGRARNWPVVRNPIIRRVTALKERNNAFPWTNQIITHAQLRAWRVKCPPFLFFSCHGHVNLCLHRLTENECKVCFGLRGIRGMIYSIQKLPCNSCYLNKLFVTEKFQAYVS